MPRGRHRHSEPLHRLLPPMTVAGTAVVLAAAALFAGDTELLRLLTLAAALTAVAGAAVARAWDRSAGRRVAELTTLRARDEWRADERIAELETDLEEHREIRGRLEKKLRGKRSELARLRTEHADLLRRYATAESERARALEARRRLQLEGAAGHRPLALGTGASPVGPAAYLKAAEALRNLPRNAAQQQARQTVEEARRREIEALEEPQGRHASGKPAPRFPSASGGSSRRSPPPSFPTPSRSVAGTPPSGPPAGSTSSARSRLPARKWVGPRPARLSPRPRLRLASTNGPARQPLPRSSTSPPTTTPNNSTSPASAPRRNPHPAESGNHSGAWVPVRKAAPVFQGAGGTTREAGGGTARSAQRLYGALLDAGDARGSRAVRQPAAGRAGGRVRRPGPGGARHGRLRAAGHQR